MSGFFRDVDAADHGNGRVVDEVWVWVKVYGPEDEGIAAVVTPDGTVLPCVFAKRSTAESMRPLVMAVQRREGLAHVLRRYGQAVGDL